MKIIRHGVKPEDYIYTATCLNCNCQFEFFEHEADDVTTPSEHGNTSGEVTVTCPHCDEGGIQVPWSSRKPPQDNRHT